MYKLIQEIDNMRQIKEPDYKAGFQATACSSTKFVKFIRLVTIKAKAVKACKTGWIEEKLNCIIFFLRMQTQMILHNIDWLVSICIWHV